MLASGGVFFNLVNYSLRGTKQSTCSLSIVNCSRCGHQLQIRVIMRRDVQPRDRVNLNLMRNGNSTKFHLAQNRC